MMSAQIDERNVIYAPFPKEQTQEKKAGIKNCPFFSELLTEL